MGYCGLAGQLLGESGKLLALTGSEGACVFRALGGGLWVTPTSCFRGLTRTTLWHEQAKSKSLALVFVCLFLRERGGRNTYKRECGVLQCSFFISMNNEPFYNENRYPKGRPYLTGVCHGCVAGDKDGHWFSVAALPECFPCSAVKHEGEKGQTQTDEVALTRAARLKMCFGRGRGPGEVPRIALWCLPILLLCNRNVSPDVERF